MAARTTQGTSRIPVPDKKSNGLAPGGGGGGGKNSNPARGRKLSLVETNIRNGSKSSVSSYSEEVDLVAAKLSVKSSASADGTRPSKKRTPGSNKGTDDKSGNKEVGARGGAKGVREGGARASNIGVKETGAKEAGAKNSHKSTKDIPADRGSNMENKPPRLELQNPSNKHKIKVTVTAEEEISPARVSWQVKEDQPVLPPDVINIDIEDGMYEYSRELIVYLREQEQRFLLDSNYLDGGSITPAMRALLVDWLIQVQHHLNLCQETLYISIAILDTTLAKRDITPEKLQLVGVTALLLASKLEEYYSADLNKLVHLTSNSYTIKQILKMEWILLEVLNFQIYFPEVMSFLRRYVRAALRDQDVMFSETCQYLVDSSLVRSNFSTLLPSKKAAACVLAANCLFAVGASQPVRLSCVWSPSLEYYTGYSVAEISSLAANMLSGVIKPLHEGAYSKFKSSSRHKGVVLHYHLSPETVKEARRQLLLLLQQ